VTLFRLSHIGVESGKQVCFGANLVSLAIFQLHWSRPAWLENVFIANYGLTSKKSDHDRIQKTRITRLFISLDKHLVIYRLPCLIWVGCLGGFWFGGFRFGGFLEAEGLRFEFVFFGICWFFFQLYKQSCMLLYRLSITKLRNKLINYASFHHSSFNLIKLVLI